MKKKKVLFLCTGNSARSQLAEAILRTIAGERYEVYSAGLEPKGVHPLAIQVLHEQGIDTAALRSKNLNEYVGKMSFDTLITLCSDAEERCPFFPGSGVRLHWPFDDPAAVKGTAEEKLTAFRQVRDQIQAAIQGWMVQPEG